MLLKLSRHNHGFALPTVLIASIVMMVVLLSAAQVTIATRSSLDSQYYDNLARDAAESGAARAEACLKSNNYIPQWGTAGFSLRPNSTCVGTTTECTTADCYVMVSGNVRTRFVVNAPVTQTGYQLVTSTGIVELLRSSNSSVWRTYSYDLRSRLSAVVTFNNVVFGYNYENIAQDGAFFFTLAADGKVQALGGNSYGQLGVGNTTPTTTPKDIAFPVGVPAVVSVHTSMLAHGYNSFFIMSDGSAYGAGRNSEGSLGLANIVSPQTSPQRLSYYEGGTSRYFGASGNKKAKYAATLGYAAIILTEDGYLYSAGLCDQSVLGRSCTDRTRFVQLTVLSPATSSVRPTNKIALDSYSVYSITEGGRIYGWGDNELGQLAKGNRTDSSVPTQISTYGNTSMPTAVQVAFDGDTVYIVGSDGKMKGAGRNDFGQIGKKYVSVVNANAGDTECMDGDSSWMYFYTCIADNPWQEFEFRASDNTIRRTLDGGVTEQCMDDGDGTTPRFVTCNGSQDQKFILRPSQEYTIYGIKSNKCLDNSDGLGGEIGLWPCDVGEWNMMWWISDELSLAQFELPVSAGNAVKVVTDQWSTLVLGSNGEVWGAGLNVSGQLGNGRNDEVQNAPTRFILPGTVKAIDVFNTGAGMGTVSSFNYRYANTFVVGDDGRVYGAGDNEEGQLGNGSTADFVSTPVVMNVIDGSSIRAKQAQSGFGTTVVLTESGMVYTVGNNSNGQLGDGTTNDSSTPKANIYTNFIPRTLF